MNAPGIRRGQPLRALAGLGLVLALWLGWRFPQMRVRAQAVAAQLLPVLAVAPTIPPMAPTIPPMAAPLLPLKAADPVRPVDLPSLEPDSRRSLPPYPPPTAISPPVTAGPPPLLPPPDPAPAGPVAATAGPEASAMRIARLAYDRLRDGQRRQAAALFDAALALQPGNAAWRADRANLGRRWQVGGFALVRDGGRGGPAASPVLGGGQMGGSIAMLIDPHARRPLALVARANVAADPAGIRTDTAQAAIGVRQALAQGVSISAERLIALGNATRGDWTVRLAAGGQPKFLGGRFSAYGEAGVLGSGGVYAGAQASARVLRIGPATFGSGAWASVQTGTPDVWRVDIGPSINVDVKGIRLQADWRQRVAGNAAPGSGPVVTMALGF